MKTMAWIMQLAHFLTSLCCLVCSLWGVTSSDTPHYVTHDVRMGQADITGRDVIVRTVYGELLGKRKEGVPEAGGVTSHVDWFLGVRYARPPLQDLRFKNPERPAPWRGVRTATRFGFACPQTAFLVADVDEDCLYLNIYTPYEEANQNVSYPVMVFIHGGSYTSGSGNTYMGHIIAQYGVVIVTVNYRLALLGFLSARDPLLPGNYGLYDQREALLWVQENIAAFRGDPKRVTLFGSSAGSASVGFQTLSPLSKGLFHQAILQSGVPLSFWAMHNNTVDLDTHVRQIAELLGCAQAQLSDVISCLKDLSWQHLGDPPAFPRISWSHTDIRPCVDGRLLLHEAREGITSRASQVNMDSVMIGYVNREWTKNLGVLFYELHIAKPMFTEGMTREVFNALLTHVTQARFGWDSQLTELVRHMYTNWSAPNDELQNRQLYGEFIGDLAMLAPSIEMANYFYSQGKPVYFFEFDHPYPQNKTDDRWYDQYHGVDLEYVFGSPYHGVDPITGATWRNSTGVEEAQRVSRRVMQMWTNYAKHGKPTLQGDPQPWQPFTPRNTDYFHITASHSSMKYHVRADKIHFWNHVYPRMRSSSSSRRHVLPAGLDPPSTRAELWILVAVCIILLVLLLICVALLYKGNQQRQQHATPSPVLL